MDAGARQSPIARHQVTAASGTLTAVHRDSFRVADNPGITDEPKAARGLRSDWLATEHVLQTYRGSKHSGFAATLCSQLQT